MGNVVTHCPTPIITSQTTSVTPTSQTPTSLPKTAQANFLVNPEQGTIPEIFHKQIEKSRETELMESFDDIVVNLSTHPLTSHEIQILSLGLGYCPEANFDIFETIKDINLFTRKLTLKLLHHKTDQPDTGFNALMQLTQRECKELRELLLEEELFAFTRPSSPSPLLEILESTSSTTPAASDPMTP